MAFVIEVQIKQCSPTSGMTQGTVSWAYVGPLFNTEQEAKAWILANGLATRGTVNPQFNEGEPKDH